MIEATCSACGTHNRIAETDVPAGAKFVTCTSCKSRVPLPAAAKPAIPSVPKLPTSVPPIPSIKPPAKQPATPPAIPSGPPAVSLGPAGAGPIPVPAPASGGGNDIIDLSDLPAPRRASPLGAAAESKPAPRSGLAAALEADLPAPKAQPRAAGGPPPAALDLDDLLGTQADAGVADLPAPKARASADLPAPKQARPATPSPASGGETDLPAPKPRSPITRPAAPAGPISLDLDLPAPRAAKPAEVSDLPAPKAGIADLPAPKHTPGSGAIDLPMPKPGGAGIDLPAPKGFFDDLPQPARGGGASAGDDIAPKGFFDDLPQPAKGQRPNAAITDDVAPKGFFDDLPQPAKGQRPGPMPTDDIAPKGFFDDLPQPATISPPAPVEARTSSRGAVDLGDDPIEQIDLASEAPQELELEAPAEPPPAAPSAAFDDLDLSAPSAAPGARAQALDEDRPSIKISTPKTPAGAKPPERPSLPSLRGGPSLDEPLELEEPRETQSISQRLGPKPQKPLPEPKPAKKPVNRKVALGLVLGLAAAGGGGFYFYQRHAAAQERQNTIDEELARARKAIVSENANRWTVATNATTKVLELDPKNGAAAGLAAEAAFASALADGKNVEQRFTAARKRINDALGNGVTGPELDRASALGAITTNPTGAITKLKGLAAKAPKDPWLQLYLAWANAAAGDGPAAIAAYDAAVAAPATKLLALLGRARIKLDNADSEGARTDFDAVLALQKDNIPAQVGLAAALPASQAQQQESDLLAIIARKDFKDADPRAKVQAYVLAGDAARRTNRLDAARERYRKALEIDKRAIAATVSLAEVELADGKRETSQQLVDDALKQIKDHPPALLVQAALSLANGKPDEAEAIIKQLDERTPPIAKLLQIRVGLLRGKVLEAKKQDDAAVDAYIAAAKLAGEIDLTPTMAAIAKLTEMARAAAAAKDTAREAELKARAEEQLAALAAAAAKDPSLAFTLGVAYQQAGEPAQAEPWLRKVLEARPADPDAMFQLAVVLRSLDRAGEALAMLEKAAAAAPDRGELQLELARTYEALGKDGEAGTLYDKLVAGADVPQPVREHAGLFYVRTKQLPKAGEQGKKILEATPDAAIGHYLLGEGLLAKGDLDAARAEFTEAVTQERSARYLDAQGRAYESISIAKKDVAMQDSAIRAYDAAIALDPTLASSQLGLGRLYVARNEMKKAVPPLVEANKLRGNDAEIAFNLGRAYQVLGEKKVALQWLQLANRTSPRPETAYRLGEMYSTEGVDDGRAAAAAYGEAYRLALAENKQNATPLPPWLGEALFQWGRRSLDVGDEATARSAWEKWLGMQPPPPAGARRSEVERLMATTLRRP